MGRPGSSRRRGAGVALSVTLVVGATAVLVQRPAEAAPGQAADVPPGLEGWDQPVDIEPPDWVESSSAPMEQSNGSELLPEAAFPDAAVWQVPVGTAGETAPAADEPTERPVDLTVWSDAGSSASATEAASGAVQVDVLPHDQAQRLGASGFVFSVDGADGASLADLAGDGELPAELSIDYSGFAPAYGGDYAHRLQVVAMPACAIEDPLPEGCVVRRERLDASNDLAADRMTLDVADLATVADGLAEVPEGLAEVAENFGDDEDGLADIQAEVDQPEPEGAPVPEVLTPFGSSPEAPQAALAEVGAPEAAEGGQASATSEGDGAGLAGESDPLVLAVTAGGSSDVGTYEATPLSVAGEWNVAPGTGEFSYSYPIDVPAPPGGTAPTVGLGYSSGAIDGMTLGTNAQAPQTGVGWGDFANGFISRAYQPCVERGVVDTFDLCWWNHNATISLGGVSGPLIPLDTDYRQWRVQNDPGWRVERVGTPGGGGDVPGQHSSEYWIVTGPDGTEYWFGLHYDPDTARSTFGVWWVPIIGDQAGEPCSDTPSGEVCEVAWRWNLDRVVDPNGNLTTYFYDRETNKYDAVGGLGGPTSYVRSGMLERIEYGGRDGTTLAPAGQVVLERQNRCKLLVSNCPAAAPGSTSYYDDVPFDLICTTQASCPSQSPVFFSSQRYSAVRTEVRVGTDWKMVAQENLLHDWKFHNASGGAKLYMMGIQRAGTAGGFYPSTEFQHIQLLNRVDATGEQAMPHWRIDKITNPFGASIDVVYGRQNPCPADYESQITTWDDNAKDCFPQTIVGSSGQHQGIFNKWLVMSVTETPGYSQASATMTTAYTYEADAEWAYDSLAFGRDDAFWGWTNWRGYGTVTVTQGSSTTRMRLFRGMHDDYVVLSDPNPCVCHDPTLQVEVEGLLDPTLKFLDLPVLTGRPLEEQRLDANGDPAEATLYTYEVRETATPLPDYQDFSAPTWAGVSSTTESVALDAGGYRERGGTTTYNTSPAPQPIRSEESGWLDVTGDERCSITDYADPAVPDETGTWMWVFPEANRVVEGACDADPLGDVLSESETAYDGQAVGAPPTKGNVTVQRSQIDGTRSAETRTTIDALGRPVTVESENGSQDPKTTTIYTAAAVNQIPTQTGVTQENGANDLVTTTTYEPEKGGPATILDPNGNLSSLHYDEFHRLDGVRLQTERGLPGDPDENQSWRFAYQLSPGKTAPPVVRSDQLASVDASGVGHYEASWSVYDGLLRGRQTQTLSPTAGDVIVDLTTYDDQGRAFDEIAPEAVPGTPGAGFLVPGGGADWQNRTRHHFDELGRAADEQQIAIHSGGTDTRTTTYAYTDDTVTVTGPTGARSRETVDGLGRTIEAAEWDDTDEDSTVDINEWATAAYTYDLADNLLSATDPAGNVTSYGYNLAGWRTSQDDPDRGAATYSHDLLGNLRTSEDATATQLWTTYDLLSRPTARRSGSDTGTPLATWTYDAATLGLGKLASSTRHTSGGDWTTAVSGYDERGRALGSTLTVPAGVPGLSGTPLSVTQAYDRTDRPTTTTYSAVGGLASETVTTTYDSLGMAFSLVGDEAYVRGAGYDGRGRPSNEVYGPPDATGPLSIWQAKFFSYDTDQHLAGVEVVNAAATATPDDWVTVLDRTLSYDDAGNLAERASTVQGLGSSRECFDYDSRMRLTAAWTVGVSAPDTCATGTKGSGDGGYERHYFYTPDGRIASRTEAIAPTFGDLIPYTYPSGTAPDQPHAPTDVGFDTYAWDANGNLESRTVGGTTETFDWDDEQRLASIDGPGSDDSSFVYDADGARLLRTTATGRTLYFAGQEITASTDGSTVTAVRSYSFNGKLVATRTPAGVQYLVTDERGSVELTAPSLGVPTAARSYDPYGQERAVDGTGFETDRGYVGQVEDDSSGLSYLNARYYDTTTGMFTAPDPVMDVHNIKSLNPYTYSSASPVTMSDPAGTVSTYTFGLELENAALRGQNKSLMDHIGKLNGAIADLQNVVKRQQNYITKLVTHIRALEATIRQQQSYINKLQARVRQLAGLVQYWYGRAQFWKGEARKWYFKATYYRGIIGQLVERHFKPEYQQRLLDDIDAGRGITSWSGERTLIVGAAAFGPSDDLQQRVFDTYYESMSSQIENLASRLDEVEGKYQALVDSTDPFKMDGLDQVACHYGTSSGNLYEGSASGGTVADVVDFFGDVAGTAAQWVPEVAAAVNTVCDVLGV